MNRLVPLVLIVRVVRARRAFFKSCLKLLVLASLDVVLVAAASVRVRA